MATTITFDKKHYQIALSLLPGIGPVISRKLIQACGSAEAVFKEKKKLLTRISGIGEQTAARIQPSEVLQRAEEELLFIEKHRIDVLFYEDERFPFRLKQCYDSPMILYHKGTTNFSNPRIISIVGTRKMTDYGRQLCETVLHDLAALDVLVVSGLAYGVDICAHKAALQNDLQTIGVLAHGLDQIYPTVHRGTAKQMVEQGGLLSDYPSQTKPDRENFPRRNRIIAGLADATIVIESGAEGGSMISAEFANTYNREVFAFPGRINDSYSAGCLKLIKNHKAALIESANDVVLAMGWDQQTQPKKTQTSQRLHFDLKPEEEQVVNAMRDQGNIYIDELCGVLGFNQNKVSAILLGLEFSGVVKALPGKMYRLN